MTQTRLIGNRHLELYFRPAPTRFAYGSLFSDRRRARSRALRSVSMADISPADSFGAGAGALDVGESLAEGFVPPVAGGVVCRDGLRISQGKAGFPTGAAGAGWPADSSTAAAGVFRAQGRNSQPVRRSKISSRNNRLPATKSHGASAT